MKIRWIVGGLMIAGVASAQARAGVMQYGERNLLGTGAYPSDPTAGATLQGLAAGSVSVATNSFAHPIPVQANTGNYPGTGQIYTTGTPAGAHDTYSASPLSVQGPQVLTVDYSGLVPANQKVDTLTLGIAADDFQAPITKEPFTAKINGVVNDALSNELNSLNLSGPKVQFFTVGLDKSSFSASNTLTLTIDRAGGGTGSDGWAVDFATVGVTTVPEPTTLCVLALGVVGLGLRGRLRPRRTA